MRAVSVAWSAEDELRRSRERRASEELRARALEIAARTETITAKVDAMNRIYRERLVGIREERRR